MGPVIAEGAEAGEAAASGESGVAALGRIKGINEGLGTLKEAKSTLDEFKAKLNEPVLGKIAEGAALQQLAERTGDSVKNLYQLREGFDAAGLGADRVAPALLAFEKALAGATDKPEQAKKAFAELGIDTGGLEKMSPTDAFLAFEKNLRSRTPLQAMRTATAVLGDTAPDALQFARSKEGWDAFRTSAPEATEMAQWAPVFTTASRQIAEKKKAFDPFFMGEAESSAGLYGVKSPLESISPDTMKSVGRQVGSAQAGFQFGKMLLNPMAWDQIPGLWHSMNQEPPAPSESRAMNTPWAGRVHLADSPANLLSGTTDVAGDTQRQMLLTLTNMDNTLKLMNAKMTNATPIMTNTNHSP